MQVQTTVAASTVVSSRLIFLLASFTAVQAAIPGEKLLDVKGYGFDEYLVIGLACFVLFVAVKHLIFHTLYFWWFTHARFHLPRAFWSLLTGKSLHERIYAHVAAAIKDSSDGEKKLLLARDAIDHYCSQTEFAPNFGPHKAKLLTDAVKESTSNDEDEGRMLVVGSSYGYVILHLLITSPPSSHLVLLERDVAAAAHVIRLCDLIGVAHKVKVICDDVPYEDLIEKMDDKGGKFDLIFTTRHSHKQQSHLALVQKIEKQELMKTGSVLFADKVVFFTDPPFLMHVRSDTSHFSCTYHQMSLEHSSYDILDGCEVCQRKE